VLARSLVLLFTLTAPTLAQAPRITRAGDPTVRNDTIYRLAVNPADHADDDYLSSWTTGSCVSRPTAAAAGRTGRWCRSSLVRPRRPGASSRFPM